MSTEALVPGTLLGFRQFRIDVQGELLPLHVGNRPWRPGTTRAVCVNHPEHRPPVTGCTCGLHAWHHADDALSRDDETVVAAIRAHGRIILGVHGLRAERAEVVAVCLPARWTARRREAVAARLRSARPDLEIFTSARGFRQRFPSEDLAALGVHTRPTAHARLRRAVHLPWVLGVLALYSVMVWPPAMERVLTGGGWVALLGAFVAWQAWLVRQSMDDDA
ncbi:hypothetical protein [Nocardioides alcanivorans]|uniref:hypothetical protein n=1 Tax=Nocardioides alcanivorans TaxID=2897352 RepID=UPI001F3010A1|nr:hypothetical protein [Nocardioides alcanivorans]